jgi:acyl-CoA dehydrogenase-like protein
MNHMTTTPRITDSDRVFERLGAAPSRETGNVAVAPPVVRCFDRRSVRPGALRMPAPGMHSRVATDDALNLSMSEHGVPLYEQVKAFIANEVEPITDEFYRLGEARAERWSWAPGQLELLDSVKAKAKANGLWNFFLLHAETGEGLSNLDYAYIAQELGKNPLASECLNCSAPDTGNMEVLERVGTPEQKKKWLEPLLNGEIPTPRPGRDLVRAVRDGNQGLHRARWRRRRSRIARWQEEGFGDKIASGFGDLNPYRRVADPETLRSSGRYLVLSPKECVEWASREGEQVTIHPLTGGIHPELAWRSLHLIESDVLPHLGRPDGRASAHIESARDA